MRPLAVFIFGALLASGCVTWEGVKTIADENDDIIEAVFRHISRPEPVKKEVSHSLNLVHRVYFISFWYGADFHDPGARLLERFRDCAVPVKPLSAAVRKGSYVYDKVTGARGAHFSFDPVVRLGRRKAEVVVGFSPGGGLTGSSRAYRVAQRQGRWTVISQQLKTIS